jgi:16S rRNA processing protein RimM
VGPQGLRGECRLYPLTDYPEHLRRVKRVTVRYPDGGTEEREIASNRPHGNLLAVRLTGCETRDQAEALRDAEIWIDAADAPPLPEGQFYLEQIVGLRAVTEDGQELGRVDEVLRMPANDVYRVGSLLIPATADAVVRLDPAAGVIVTRSRAYLEGEEVR